MIKKMIRLDHIDMEIIKKSNDVYISKYTIVLKVDDEQRICIFEDERFRDNYLMPLYSIEKDWETTLALYDKVEKEGYFKGTLFDGRNGLYLCSIEIYKMKRVCNLHLSIDLQDMGFSGSLKRFSVSSELKKEKYLEFLKIFDIDEELEEYASDDFNTYLKSDNGTKKIREALLKKY